MCGRSGRDLRNPLVDIELSQLLGYRERDQGHFLRKIVEQEGQDSRKQRKETLSHLSRSLLYQEAQSIYIKKTFKDINTPKINL